MKEKEKKYRKYVNGRQTKEEKKSKIQIPKTSRIQHKQLKKNERLDNKPHNTKHKINKIKIKKEPEKEAIPLIMIYEKEGAIHMKRSEDCDVYKAYGIMKSITEAMGEDLNEEWRKE